MLQEPIPLFSTYLKYASTFNKKGGLCKELYLELRENIFQLDSTPNLEWVMKLLEGCALKVKEEWMEG